MSFALLFLCLLHRPTRPAVRKGDLWTERDPHRCVGAVLLLAKSLTQQCQVASTASLPHFASHQLKSSKLESFSSSGQKASLRP